MVVSFAGRVAYQARSVEPLGPACNGSVSCGDLYSGNYISQGQHLLNQCATVLKRFACLDDIELGPLIKVFGSLHCFQKVVAVAKSFLEERLSLGLVQCSQCSRFHLRSRGGGHAC